MNADVDSEEGSEDSYYSSSDEDQDMEGDSEDQDEEGDSEDQDEEGDSEDQDDSKDQDDSVDKVPEGVVLPELAAQTEEDKEKRRGKCPAT